MPIHPETPHDFQAESDLHVLMRVEELKNDPSRVSRARALAAQKAAEAAAVAAKITPAKPQPSPTGFRKLG